MRAHIHTHTHAYIHFISQHNEIVVNQIKIMGNFETLHSISIVLCVESGRNIYTQCCTQECERWGGRWWWVVRVQKGISKNKKRVRESERTRGGRAQQAKEAVEKRRTSTWQQMKWKLNLGIVATTDHAKHIVLSSNGNIKSRQKVQLRYSLICLIKWDVCVRMLRSQPKWRFRFCVCVRVFLFS